MRLPHLRHPARYAGLYVVDFGGSAAVGYTGEEVGMLVESEQYAGAKVYRIRKADADGTMELQAVPAARFGAEAAMCFYGRDAQAARDDFARLRQAAAESPLPCLAKLELAELPETARLRHVVALTYPAESDPDIARWLLDCKLAPGEYAESGTPLPLGQGRVRAQTPLPLGEVGRRPGEGTRGQGEGAARILETAQLLPAPWRRPRTREEVFATVKEPVQR